MRIRQIVLAAHDLAAARARLEALFGVESSFRDPGVAEFGLDNAVYAFGDQFIEVVSPVREGSAAGRHLARHGDGGYMLILQTDDLARERARWDAMGVRRVWNADLPDISASHLHPKDVGAAIVSVDEARPAPSWRWGGPGWHVRDGAAGRQRVLGVTLRAADPLAMARRWAAVFALGDPQPAGDGWRLALDGGRIDVVPGADGLAGFALGVADREAVLAAARRAGLAVTADGVDALGVRWTLQALAVDA